MKIKKDIILASIITMVMPMIAGAATHGNEGYLQDAEGSIVRNGSGGCWHTSSWTSAMAVAGCDSVAIKSEITSQPKVVKLLPQPKLPVYIKPEQEPSQAKLEKPELITQKINISEEDLFNFNRATLKSKGKSKLDEFVRDLNGVNFKVINVVGFTDRIGKAKYNQKLSLLRAEAVKDYLTQKGIPANRIEAEGKGKSLPITGKYECRGMSIAKTIACLQPDRRTEVTVVGTEIGIAGQQLSSLVIR